MTKRIAISLFPKIVKAFQVQGLLRASVGTLGLRVSAAGFGFINGIVIARLLGPEEYGVYSLVLSAVNFGATIAVLGLPVPTTRDVAAYMECEEWGKLKGVLRAVYKLTLFALLLLLSVVTVLYASGAIKTIVALPLMTTAMMLVPLMAFNQLRAAILRGLHFVVLADVPDMFVRPGIMILLLGIAYLSAMHITASDVFVMLFIATNIALGLGYWWLKVLRPEQLKAAVPELPGRAWLFDSWPFFGITLISLLEGQISLYMIGYLGGVKQAGLFYAANQLVSLIAIGLMAVNMPLQSRLASAWVRRDMVQVQKLITDAARMGAGLSLFGVAVLFGFPEVFLRIYGTQYIEASNGLQILAIGQMLNAAAGSCGVLLMMSGYQRVVMRGTMLALLITACVGYASIPEYGLVGAAVATLCGVATWNGYFVVFSLKNLGINTTVLKI